MLSLSSLFLIPNYMVFALIRAKGTLKQVTRFVSIFRKKAFQLKADYQLANKSGMKGPNLAGRRGSPSEQV